MALTAKQQRFVDEYLIDLNATQAAIRAGFSAKTARQAGNRLLTNVDIQQAIQAGMEARSGRVAITQDMVLRELAKIGFSDIRKVVRWGETMVRMADAEDEGAEGMVPYHGLALIDSTDVDDDTAAAIAEVSQGRDGLKVKLHDKKGALVDIGRHLGMFSAPGHAELDAELKRLEVEKRRAELKLIEKGGGNSNAQLLADLIARLPS
ncbi:MULTISPECIES: terminase small subunit [Pseudomonas]|uniref:terminase small subunit n=1 Tax=Pseudomonas TaxID=286 RepID=UPI000879E5D8|nr:MULTISPECIES: terminase small subunit [Pseudomonas]AZD93032.1 Phage terminase, small subunit [Pseudomonas chlororaphis subsp. aureofaciens]KAB0532803.1 terminase small subunit [Pseudomonas chlororaphis subsp. aureofaciens]TSD26009.1 terminase small subunit [Pseudomonas sp. ATCC 13985]WDG57831.1 terminase small subunit [Pseudomonas chlororaphis]WDG64044.1 terminase small subunit [Pseudomonas chlororaphis]